MVGDMLEEEIAGSFRDGFSSGVCEEGGGVYGESGEYKYEIT